MFKNISGQKQTVIGVGEVEPDAVFVVEEGQMNPNPNFENMGEYDEDRKIPAKVFGVEAKPYPPEDEEKAKSKKGVTK